MSSVRPKECIRMSSVRPKERISILSVRLKVYKLYRKRYNIANKQTLIYPSISIMFLSSLVLSTAEATRASLLNFTCTISFYFNTLIYRSFLLNLVSSTFRS